MAIVVTESFVRECFIRKLARIIYEHSEKNPALPKQEAADKDWSKAQWYIDINYYHWVKEAVQEINGKKPVKYDFQDFERDYGFGIWDIIFIKMVAPSLTDDPAYAKVHIY